MGFLPELKAAARIYPHLPSETRAASPFYALKRDVPGFRAGLLPVDWDKILMGNNDKTRGRMPALLLISNSSKTMDL
jgi:hypothetical protein